MKAIHISLLLGKYSLLLTTSFFSQTALSEVTLDGSMGTAGALAGPDYQITEDLGQRAGNNLFHSFGQFNINRSESATFSGSTGIQNVISRVTGGQASTIDGAFRSTIPAANIYFLNPSGVIFGENASLDVQGSFHASTANYLKFKDGVKFKTGMANANPILTVENPEAFGFLDNAPAPISVSGGLNKVLKVPEGATLSLVAGDMTINDRSLYAPSGQVILASAGSAGEVAFNESGIETSSFNKGGNIHLGRLAANPVPTINDTMQIADIDVSANAAGKVVIRGGQMVMDNATIWANTTDKGGGDIDISLSGDLTIKGIAKIPSVEKTPQSGITANSLGKGNVGNILLNADNLKLTHDSNVQSIAGSSGSGGDILINASSILLEGNDSKATPSIAIIAGSTGNAGNLSINNADYLEINKGSKIVAGSHGQGHGGDVSIDADNILFTGKKTDMSNSVFNAGNSGALSITTNNFKILNGATLSVANNGSGDSGDVIINAHTGNILLSEAYIFNTSHADSTGNLGSIIINANNLQIQENAGISGFVQSSSNNERIIQINSQSVTVSGEGSFIRTGTLPSSLSETNLIASSNDDDTNATPIELNVLGHLALRDGAEISTNTTTNGNAGDISLNAESIELSKALIFSDAASYMGDTQQDTSRTGNAGNISITTQSLNLANGSLITSNTRTAGRGGNITVEAKSVFLSGSKPLTDSLKLFSTISTETYSQDKNAGNAGNIKLNNVEHLDIQGGASINADTTGAGLGGELTIDAKSIFLSASLEDIQSSISASTYSSGNAGDITINNVDQLVIKGGAIAVKATGTGSGGELIINNAKSISLSGEGSIYNSGLIASTNSIDDNAGNAGNITVTSEHIDISNEGEININTTGAGKGGELIINAGTIDISGKNTTYPTGIFVLADSTEKNAGDTGDAGKATINVGHLNISDTARINASTYGNGNGGDLTINAQSITIKGNMTDDFTGIVTQANWSKGNIEYKGNAGDLTLNVTDTLALQNGATISTSTYGIGTAGDLTITANDILLNDSILKSLSNIETVNLLENSEIAKSGIINITANNSLNLENNSSISVATKRANAGEINIVSGNSLNIRDSSITTSIANGEGNGGNITVNSSLVSLDSSQIIAQAKAGEGGDISISGHLFQSPLSLIDASSEKSTNGELNLKPDTNISGNIAVFPESLLNASEHLSEHCNASNANSFVIKNRGAIPLIPGELSPTNFLDFSLSEKNLHYPSVKNPEISLKKNNQLSFNSITCIQ